MIFLSFIIATLAVSLTTGCFCPPVISPSCGCGGGGYSSYSGGGYGGGYSGGYGGGYSGGQYASAPGQATFFRDLTPFRQPYYQNQPQPQYYPQGPSQSLPPMYQLPNPRYIQPQAPLPPRQQPQYVSRPAPTPYHPTLVQEKQVYIQPAAPVAPLAESHKVTLHDNGYGEEVETTTYVPVVTAVPVVVTQAPATEAPVDEVPDFDETPVKKGEKEEFYYVYYDDKGNKVGDSRSGTTFAPENVIVEEETTVAPASVHVEVTTDRVQVNENYDDVVEETQVPVRTSLSPSYTPEAVTSTTVLFMEPRASTSAPSNENAEVIYEDETVEYEDDGHHEAVAPGPSTKKPQSGEFKRTVQDNQILVDAAETTGEGYRSRSVVSGVRIVKRFRHDERKIHSN
uniref:Ground-like domain-containing protein n=1 Tax=Caenorhabditis tropicalis TaxID=1561998 RepID=A0A1I7U718_9PELO